MLDGKLGDVAFKTGDQVLARRHLERALGDLGRRVPRTSFGWIVAALKEVIVQALHTLARRCFVGQAVDRGSGAGVPGDPHDTAGLAYVYWFSAGKIPCAWTHLRGMNLAERYPPTLELAQAYSEHARW